MVWVVGPIAEIVTECRSAFMAGDMQRYVAHTCTSRGGSGSATTR